jgi:hypothetical protein
MIWNAVLPPEEPLTPDRFMPADLKEPSAVPPPEPLASVDILGP